MIKFLKTRNVENPTRAHHDDSGIDFFVPLDVEKIQITPSIESPVRNVSEDSEGKYILLHAGEGALIPSGIKVVIPDGFDIVFDNKSGIATKYNLVIGAKVIDCSYRGEVHIHVINCSNGNKKIRLGQKLAQGIVRKVELLDVQEIAEDEFNSLSCTERGENGFGSTGN